MLNYLGPQLGGQGPVTAGLPPSVPGTMPDGVPGLPPTPSPISPQGAPASPDALAAIMNRPQGSMSPAPAEPPPPPEYATTTQEDGSILLHLKNPDGTLGPVVKVIPPIKRPGDKAQA